MSEAPLNYASPSLRNPASPWTLHPVALFFWISIALLIATLVAIVLPSFDNFANRCPSIGRAAQFLMFYGNWIASVFAAISLGWAYFYRSIGWIARVPLCIAIVLAAFYWLLALSDGAYSRMLYGAC